MNDKKGKGSYGGTRVYHSDLDWSQIHETVLMLELAAAQIMAAMRDSDRSINTLGSSFTGMATHMKAIEDEIRQLPDLPEIAASKKTLEHASNQVGEMVNEAVVAFQFYDKLAQRLFHVVDGLSGLSEVVAEPDKLYMSSEWIGLHDRIRSKFSTAEEHAMCEAVLHGMPIHTALERYLETLHNKNDDVELF